MLEQHSHKIYVGDVGPHVRGHGMARVQSIKHEGIEIDAC